MFIRLPIIASFLQPSLFMKHGKEFNPSPNHIQVWNQTMTKQLRMLARATLATAHPN
jgi:hypothetical protein